MSEPIRFKAHPARYLLHELGIPQSAVAETAGISEGRTSEMLNGKVRANTRLLAAVEQLTGRSRDDLFRWVQTPAVRRVALADEAS